MRDMHTAHTHRRKHVNTYRREFHKKQQQERALKTTSQEHQFPIPAGADATDAHDAQVNEATSAEIWSDQAQGQGEGIRTKSPAREQSPGMSMSPSSVQASQCNASDHARKQGLGTDADVQSDLGSRTAVASPTSTSQHSDDYRAMNQRISSDVDDLFLRLDALNADLREGRCSPQTVRARCGLPCHPVF